MAFKDDEERRAYFREYNKGWYQRHKERLLEKRRQHNEELRQWLRRYKSKLRCIDCGESHPACIQFHHRDREEKSFGIGGIVGSERPHSWTGDPSIEAPIASETAPSVSCRWRP